MQDDAITHKTQEVAAITREARGDGMREGERKIVPESFPKNCFR